ncbi:MAG: Gfo/Idh/MocA family oxidoreductase [Verrucomicrobiota bacterium]
MKPLRIGFLSTAQIGRMNWKAIRHSGNAVVAAVASRDVDRSRKFIEANQAAVPFETAPRALGSYEALLADRDIDAVYIPLPTGLRKEWVLRAAEAGKHVVCEKPCAVTSKDLEEMIAACRKHRVQFIDGVMFMHNPRLPVLRSALDDPAAVGQLRRITSMFTFQAYEHFVRDNIRAHGVLEPAGCLGDLGWYCIRMTLWALRWKLPKQVSGRIVSDSGPRPGVPAVPMDFSGELFFDDGVSASFFSSFLVQTQQWIQFSGTKGCLRVPDFVHPFNHLEPAFEVNREERRVNADPTGAGNVDAVAQQTWLFRNFAGIVASGIQDDFWPDIALKTQRVMDACLDSARAGGVLKPV